MADIVKGALTNREIAEKHGISNGMVYYLKQAADKEDAKRDEKSEVNGKSLEDRIRPLFEAGETFEEICMTLPSIPSAAILKVYKRLEAERGEEE